MDPEQAATLRRLTEHGNFEQQAKRQDGGISNLYRMPTGISSNSDDIAASPTWPHPPGSDPMSLKPEAAGRFLIRYERTPMEGGQADCHP